MENQSMVSIVATQDDLCNWEFVPRFDFGIDGGFDDDDSIYDLVESIHSVSSSSEAEEEEEEEDVKEGPTNHVDVSGSADLAHWSEDRGQNDAFYESSNLNLHGHVHHVDVEHDDGVHDHDDDDEEEEEDGYGVEDEMVPWDRLMRQRIRKSGKKSFGRSAKTKKSALVFTRPGCIRGKHGLGLMVY